MGARLFSKWGDTRGLTHDFDAEATIGRAADNSLVLDFSAISGHHARITFDAERDCYLIEDLESLNGTRVDGVRAERPMRLDRLHVVKFGRVCEFVFQRLGEAAPSREAEATVPPESTRPEPGEPAEPEPVQSELAESEPETSGPPPVAAEPEPESADD